MDQPIVIARIETFPLRARAGATPRSSLGDMQFRNGLLVRMESRDGAWGWGEVWCNFPPFAPVARARLIDDVIAPLLLGRSFDNPQALRPWLEARLLRMAIHTGEPGAFAQCIAGLDVAVVDLAGRRAGCPLGRLLAGTESEATARVPVYASTPNPDRLEDALDIIMTSSHRAIKLKVGYDEPGRDLREVARVRAIVGDSIVLMVDANQAWSREAAVDAVTRLSAHDIWFFEEPLLAIEPAKSWAALAQVTGARLAAGENVPNDTAFRSLVESEGLAVVQPDVAKWGGLSGALAVARHARSRGATVCPHYMGTAIGFAASLHLLAMAGGPGRVELDANPNPLRTELVPGLDLVVEAGKLRLPAGPGLGVEPDPEALRRFAFDAAA